MYKVTDLSKDSHQGQSRARESKPFTGGMNSLTDMEGPARDSDVRDAGMAPRGSHRDGTAWPSGKAGDNFELFLC